MAPAARQQVRPLFLRWSFCRALCSRGYWLVASVYLVVVADLSQFELVLLGTGQGITVVLAEVPAGSPTSSTVRISSTDSSWLGPAGSWLARPRGWSASVFSPG